jgi:methyl-accepting chemotaxis protein
MNVNQKIWTGFGVLLALVGVQSVLGYLKTRDAEQASRQLVREHVAVLQLSARAAEVNTAVALAAERFLGHREEEHAVETDEGMDVLEQTLQALAAAPGGAVDAVMIAEAAKRSAEYREVFQRLHAIMTLRGLTATEGLEGELRSRVHAVEKRIGEGMPAELQALMLTVRRNEKDYLLRADITYYDQAVAAVAQFARQVAALGVDPTWSAEVAKNWQEYLAVFKALVELDQQIVVERRVAEELAVATGECVEAIKRTSGEKIAALQVEALDALAAGRKVALGMGVIAGVCGLGLAAWIALSLRGLNRSIRQAVTQILAGSAGIRGAANELAGNSESLARAASEQAASTEEIGATMEELGSMTGRNADSANRAKTLSKEARAAADGGAADMAQMTEAMSDIKGASDEIAKIIRTIDDIAFQTNILALNAAVEAARAGSAGAGFAVVADEVRRLAQRSVEAARETAEKIEDSIRKSGRGVQISSQVAQSLTEIVAKIREVDGLVAEIANASGEQSQGITQVNRSVAEVDKLTQSNAASAEEMASASEELVHRSVEQERVVTELSSVIGGVTLTAPRGAADGADADNPEQRGLDRPESTEGSAERLPPRRSMRVNGRATPERIVNQR